MEFIAFTIILALALNCCHWQSLALTFVVGAGLIVPVPVEHGAVVWYSICILIEISLFSFAILLRTSLSFPIALLSLLFIAVHILGYIYDGSKPDSPYHYFAQSINYAEALSCVLMSHPIIQYLKGKQKCLLKY